MNAKTKMFHACFVFILLTAACTPQASPPSPPTVIDVENAVRILPTQTESPTALPSWTPTSFVTDLSLPATLTNTPIPTPTDVLAFIGTPLAEGAPALGRDNFSHLKQVGQWGRGSILAVSFIPDGKSFIAISEMGWAIYNMDALDQPPQWVTFDEPILFNEYSFNEDGTKIRFVLNRYNGDKIHVKSYPSGEIQNPSKPENWGAPNGTDYYSDVRLTAPDGTKVFQSTLGYGEYLNEVVTRTVHNERGDLLYTLQDAIPEVTYSDRNGPEGCDLSVFSMCGNALAPVATAPRKVIFSSDSSTFTILYDPPSLYTGIMRAFSYARVYNSANGDLIGALGGFTKPVQDLNYSPDGTLLLVGFVDGSLVLWDVQNAKTIYGTRHMNAPAWKLLYSPDSKYLLIQRADEIEVRLTRNGSLVYRFAAVEFAVSPLKNWVALGDADGNIQIRDLDTGKTVQSLKAHTARVYSIAFSPEGLYLASSGQDCDIKLWDLETGKVLHHFEETAVDAYEIGFSSRIFSTYLEFIPGTNMLIGFGSWGTVVNWNVDSGATNYVIQSPALEYYNGMITLKPHFPEFFSVDVPNNHFFINENRFDLTTGESLGTVTLPPRFPEGCAPSGPISKDGNLMFTRGYDSQEGKICILRADYPLLLGVISVTQQNDDLNWVDWMYLSPDGKQLIVTVGSGVVYVYQIVQ